MALSIVIVVLVVVIELKLVSAALVAVMMQLPAAVVVRVDEEIVQLPETLVKVIAPAPEPPEVESERSLP